MQINQPLGIAMHTLATATVNATRTASTLESISNLLKVANDAQSATIDMEALAGAFLGLGICLVHKDVVSQALEVVKLQEAGDTDEYDKLRELIKRLQLAIDGKAQE